ncbi:MAG TPA: hypothetical protein PKL08_00800 [Thermoanaerobaculaceae bacterium]|nr:hypothetical protein [Thermoanaerobaculaceae bacterium]
MIAWWLRVLRRFEPGPRCSWCRRRIDDAPAGRHYCDEQCRGDHAESPW